MTTTHTEQPLAHWNAGLYVHMDITIRGAAAVSNDGIALGAAIADLQREGWRLEALEHSDEEAIAKFFRRWSLESPRPVGPSVAMGMEQESPA